MIRLQCIVHVASMAYHWPLVQVTELQSSLEQCT